MKWSDFALGLEANLWAFGRICREHSAHPEFGQLISKGLKQLLSLLSHGDEKLVVFACTALGLLFRATGYDEGVFSEDGGALPRLIELMSNESKNVQLASLKAMKEVRQFAKMLLMIGVSPSSIIVSL